MAEEKQLTVAELLARNAKERGTDNKPRRRRRRSLEDGGVSVAELTGSLPKVDAKPAEAKHSNVDIDATASVIPAPAAADAAAKEDSAKPETAKEETPNADSVQPDSAAEEKAAKAAAEARRAEEIKRAEFARKAAAAKAAAKAAAEKAAAEKAAAEQAAAEKAAAEQAAAEEAAAEQAAAEKAAAEKAAAEEAAAEEAAKAAAAKTDAEDDFGALSLEQTTVIDKVEDAPEQFGDTGVIPAVEKFPEEADEEAAADEDAMDLGLVAEEEAEEEEDSKPNPVAVVFLVLVGILLGAVIFKGFEVLWGSMSHLVVGILAVAVCGIIGGIVHALRTEKDGLSVGLSVVAGLLLTFGPLLLV